MNNTEITRLIRREVAANRDPDKAVERVLDQLPADTIRALAAQVLQRTARDELAILTAGERSGNTLSRVRPVRPYDTRGSIERADTRIVEDRVMHELEAAETKDQERAVFMQLAPQHYRVPGCGPMLARDMTREHWLAWIDQQEKRKQGIDVSISHARRVLTYLVKMGADTLGEALYAEEALQVA